MSDKDVSEEKLKEIADALDRVVGDLPWHQSVFLKALGKKFENIRDEFKRDVGLGEHAEKLAQTEKDRFALKEGQQVVFVSIYNAQGSDMNHWERIIANLSTQSVSRPTYSTDNAAREMIRSKSNVLNEAYVSVHINKSDIRTPPDGKAPRDRLGNILLLLKENAITKQNIRKFYHKSGVYEYKSGQLNRVEDMNLADA